LGWTARAAAKMASDEVADPAARAELAVRLSAATAAAVRIRMIFPLKI
jgi:hypothetical protein